LAVGPHGSVQRNFENRGRSSVNRISPAGPDFGAEFALADLGDPWLVFVGAEVEEIGMSILDQIAWQRVNIAPASGPGQ